MLTSKRRRPEAGIASAPRPHRRRIPRCRKISGETAELLALLPAAYNDGVVVYDADLRYVVWNPVMERLTGVPAERVIGTEAYSHYPPGSIPEEAKAQLRRALGGEVASTTDVRMPLPGGGFFWARCTYVPLRDRRGRIRGVAGFVHHLQESGDILEKLSEERTRDISLINLMREGVWVVSGSGATAFASTRLADMMCCTPEHFQDRPAVDWVYIDDRPLFHRMLVSLRTACAPQKLECRMQRPRGGLLPVQLSAAPIADRQGMFIGTVIVVSDLSERWEAERQRNQLLAEVVRTEKMVALGTLASGIAHEFNNLLQIILSSAWMAQQRPEADTKDALRTIIETAERAGAIVKNLLTTVRPAPSAKPQECFVSELLKQVLSLIGHRLRTARIEVRWERNDPAVVAARPAELLQVFLSIISNAIDAMLPRGGELVVSVRQESDDLVRVSFRDHGCGVPLQHRARLFDPFFSTKSILAGGASHAAGLGLYVAYAIVREHGGDIWHEPADPGAIFHVALPAIKPIGRIP